MTDSGAASKFENSFEPDFMNFFYLRHQTIRLSGWLHAAPAIASVCAPNY